MKVSPLNPNAITSDTAPSASAQAARERAIARLSGNAPQGQGQPVPAEVAQAQANASVSEGQSDTVVDDSSPETTTDAETPVAKTEEPISSQYAVLARKEKAHRAKVQAQEAAIKARETAIAEREAAVKAQEASYKTDYIPKQKLTDNTIETLLEAGVSYDKITEMMLQTPSQLDPQTKALIAELRAEIQAVKGETESTKKSITQSQEAAYTQAVSQIRKDVTKMVSSGDTYECIREAGAIDDVVELIERTYKEDGDLLTNEEALQQVEEELAERMSKYAKLSKIQQKLQASNTKTSPQTPVSTKQEKQQQPAKTLTNNLGGSRQLTARERAILAFENKLGK